LGNNDIQNSNIQAALTDVEASALAEHEAVIERGLSTFVEVGEALVAIQAGRLYRATYARFDDYLRERWGDHPTLRVRSRQRVQQLAQALDVSKAFDAGEGPQVESTRRALFPLKDPADRREAWEEAVQRHGPESTAKQVRAIVRERLGPDPGLGRRRRRSDTEKFLRWLEMPSELPPPPELDIPEEPVEEVNDRLQDVEAYVSDFREYWDDTLPDRRATAERSEQNRELRRATERELESRRGLSSGPYRCPNRICGRFKSRPSQICSWCNWDEVPHGAHRREYDKAHGCEEP
jgi:hypothetical protein